MKVIDSRSQLNIISFNNGIIKFYISTQIGRGIGFTLYKLTSLYLITESAVEFCTFKTSMNAYLLTNSQDFKQLHAPIIIA